MTTVLSNGASQVRQVLITADGKVLPSAILPLKTGTVPTFTAARRSWLSPTTRSSIEPIFSRFVAPHRKRSGSVPHSTGISIQCCVAAAWLGLILQLIKGDLSSVVMAQSSQCAISKAGSLLWKTSGALGK